LCCKQNVKITIDAKYIKKLNLHTKFIFSIIRPQKLLLGEISLHHEFSPSRLIVEIENVITHPKYQSPFVYNDIALLKMSKKINISRAIYPACLPQTKHNLFGAAIKNQNFTAAGWGVLGNGG